MSQISLEPTGTFGAYLRFLRRRARLTQTELGIAVGYSHGQISMLESGQRAPDVTAVMALFVGALGVQGDKQAATRLIELARSASLQHKGEAAPVGGAHSALTMQVQQHWQQTELGLLESVPPLPSGYVPRAQTLHRLELLIQRERRVAICGLAGMGKSTLAAAYAHGYARTHPVFWFTCGEGSAAASVELLRQLALFVLAYGGAALAAPAMVSRIAAGETPGPLRQQVFLLAGELSQLRAPLLVFDAAHFMARDEPLRDMLQRLATLGPYSRHLFVTREWLDLENLPHFMVGGLELEEALALCGELTGNGSTPAIGRPSFEQIYAHTAGSPLLMRLAVSRLEQEAQSLPAIVGAMVAGQLVHALVTPLSPAARLLLDFLAIWSSPANLSLSALSTLLTEAQPGYEHSQAVDELRRTRLIDYAAHATVHPLLGAPLVELLASQPERKQMLHRLAAQWATSHGNPVTAACHLGAAGDLAAAVTLLDADVAVKAGGLPGAVAAVQELVILARQQRPGPATNSLLCQVLTLQGDLLIHTVHSAAARASYREALELSDVPLVKARIAAQLALCLLQIGLAQEALALSEDTLAALPAGAGMEGTALHLQLGSTRVRALLGLARYDEAATLCQEALDLARQLRPVKPGAAEEIAANAQRGLGYIARRRGQFAAAHRHLERALIHARDARLPILEAEILGYLSATLRDLGDFPGARRVAEQALAAAQDAGNDHLAANLLHYMSITSYYHYDLAAALAYSEAAMRLRRQMGDGEGMVSCAILQAVVYGALADLPQAQAAIDRARRDSLLYDNRWLEGMALYIFGIVHTLLADLAPAAAALSEALTIDSFVQDGPSRESAAIFLGINLVAQGRLEEAAAIEAQLVADMPVEVELLGGLLRGMACVAAGNVAAAQAVAQAVIQRARATGYLIYAAEAAKIELAAAAPPALAQLPAFVCCHGPP